MRKRILPKILPAGAALALAWMAQAGLAGPAGTPAAGVAAQGQGGGIRPHMLTYEVTLQHALERSGIINASGGLTSKLTGNACEGWTSDSRMQVRFVFRRMGVRDTDTRVSGWESDDGNVYFSVLQRRLNGRLMETIQVRARRARAGEPFVLEMAKPEKRRETLPARTLFPTGGLKKILAAARAGRRHLSLALYEGDEELAPQHVVVTIGAKRSPLAAAAQGAPAPRKGVENGGAAGGKDGAPGGGDDDLALLARMAYWPVSMAYYGPLKVKAAAEKGGKRDEEALIKEEARRRGVPDYEVSFRLYENGVTGDALLIYDDYTLRARVTGLKMLPARACE